MTGINYKLLDILSPGWAKKFRRGLTPDDYNILWGQGQCCILGCFWGYTDSYLGGTASFCSTCANLAQYGVDRNVGIARIVTDRLRRDGKEIRITRLPNKFTKRDPLRKLDRQAITELNGALEFLYNHAKEKHPEILIQKLEKAAGVKP